MQSGLKIPQISNGTAKAEFRRLEREALLSLKGWSRSSSPLVRHRGMAREHRRRCADGLRHFG